MARPRDTRDTRDNIQPEKMVLAESRSVALATEPNADDPLRRGYRNPHDPPYPAPRMRRHSQDVRPRHGPLEAADASRDLAASTFNLVISTNTESHVLQCRTSL
jgi:hypothetical protein